MAKTKNTKTDDIKPDNTKTDNVLGNNILELRHIADNDLEIPTPPVAAFEEKTPEPPKEAQIWAYQGVVGGAGVTSLAVQVAWELSTMDMAEGDMAKEDMAKGDMAKGDMAKGDMDRVGMDGNKAKVLLVDLDFERGDCAAYLDMKPSISITELNDTEGRMDENLAATFISTVSPNLSLLSANTELGGNDLLSPNALLALLDIVSNAFDYIILDVPPMWRSWTQAVIGAADKFALVTEARVPALHLTKKMAEDIRGIMAMENLPAIILNKYERRSLRNGLTLGDVHKVLGRETCAQICTDGETLRTAINTGKPAGTVKPHSQYTKSVCTHVRDWAGMEAIVHPRRRSRRVARR